MAYINQDQKKEKAAAIKKMIGEKYADLKIKYTMGIAHSSTLRFTIAASTIDFKAIYTASEREAESDRNGEPISFDYITPSTDWQVNEYYLSDNFKGKTLGLLQDVMSIMMAGNHNNSDIMTDYFDVGWYIDITIGRWNKPYILLTA